MFNLLLTYTRRFNFFKYEVWQGRRGEEEKKIRGRGSRKGKAHGGTVTRLLRCPGEIAMVIPSSLSESSLKQKLTFDPSTRNARPGTFPCLLYNFRIFAHIPLTYLGKINRRYGKSLLSSYLIQRCVLGKGFSNINLLD